MIIGIDASRANKEQKTGVEWYAYFVIEEMKKMTDDTVHVIVYSDEPLRGKLAELPKGWESRVLTWPPKRFWTQIRMSWEMWRRPPDVLWIPAHVFPIIHPKKTVMTVHDVAAVRFPQTYNWFERWYSVVSARWAMRWLWRIITPSVFTKKEMEKLRNEGGSDVKDNIFVVSHGVNKTYRVIDDVEKIQEVCKKYRLEKPFVLSLGRLEEKKNTARMMHVFDMLKRTGRYPDLQYVLIGKPGYGYEQVEYVRIHTKHRDDIHILGWIETEDLPYLLNAAEVLFFASLYEGFGLPVLEAFASGTPVVAGKGSSLEEVGLDAAIYVDPHDDGAMQEALERILKDENLRDSMIEKGYTYVKEYSWERCAKKTLDILVS